MRMRTAGNQLRDAASLFEGLAESVPLDLRISGLEMDSRRVVPGSLFRACKGHDSHGRHYAEQAIARGAVGVAWEPDDCQAEPDLPVPNWPVERLRNRAGEVAARYFDYPSRHLTCIGITGTDGKTSTAYLLAHALGHCGQQAAYMGTLGFGLMDAMALPTHTTPDPIAIQRWLRSLVDQRVPAMVMEVSSHALDQGRTTGVDFDAAILTNIGRDHLDYHGDLARYAAAKRRLFDLPQLGLRAFNRDDPHGAQWARDFAGAAVYGIGGDVPESGLYALADQVELTTSGLEFLLRTPQGDLPVRSGLFGRFNIYNLLATALVLLQLEHALPAIGQALARLGTVPGRMEGFALPDGRLAVVDYAHTPQALAHALESLRAHCAGKLVCVFGCGGDRDRGKRALMGEAAARLADAVIITDDNPRRETPESIVSHILDGITDRSHVQVEHDRDRAIRQAVAQALPGDVVLIAGKGHETEQIVGNERRPFSDRGLAAQLMQEVARGAA